MKFEAFQKIPRLRRDCIVTEKIDGTNGQILITEDHQLWIGSRNQWISTPDNRFSTDPFGFAKWAEANKDQIIAELGVGRHYGEWWGSGIQRGYGLQKGEKRFSLFNTSRWKDVQITVCSVVPVLYEGPFDLSWIDRCLASLREDGSRAAPGFMRPEGVVVFHKAANYLLKQTIEKDDEPKGKQEAP